MNKFKVYITSRSFGKFNKKALNLLKSFAEVKFSTLDRPLTKEELLNIVKDVDGLIVGMDEIGKDVINHSGRLKIIARHGVEFSNIDLKAATERKVIVTYTPHANADSVADFTMGLILSVARHIAQAHNSTRKGLWEATKFLGVEIHGKTLGLIGLGQIGYRVAKRAKGFNMRIVVYDPYIQEKKIRKLKAELVDLDTLLKESDVISIHVPLTKETKNMIGKREINLMKKNSFLINTSRGLVVNEEALYDALKKKRIAGAAIDVFSREPPDSDCPLFKLENVIVTPHIGAYTHEAIARMDAMNAEDIVRFIKGKKPRFVANPEVLERIFTKV